MTAQPSILIIGGGAFGTSTAYYLAHRGCIKVTVLDRFVAPSEDAAATDLNKIVRFDYPNPLYSKLGLEVMKIWETPNNLCFHDSVGVLPIGRISGVHKPAGFHRAQLFLRMATAALARGFWYVNGDAEWVKKLLYNDRTRCIGALGNNGQLLLADLIILCSGANTAALIEAKEEIIA